MAKRVPPDERVNLDRLDAYLLSDHSPDNALGVSEIDGLLTALIIGPEMILPSDWLPVIWDHEQPSFTDAGEAEAVIGTIMGRYNEILSNLNGTPASANPVFERTPDGKVLTADWCSGFVDGMRLRPAAWTPLVQDEECGELLTPVLALGAEPEDYKLFGLRRKPSDAADRQVLLTKAPDLIVDSIFAVWDYWQETRRESVPIRALAESPLPPTAPKRKLAKATAKREPKVPPTDKPAAFDNTTHIIRASLKARLYRDIEIASDASLYDLAEAIIQSFDFDPDHAFGFFNKMTGNIYDSTVKYELFADMEGGSGSRSVKRTSVNAVYRRIGTKMLFLFDYGDEWRFMTECKALGVRKKKVGYPRVVATVGKAPPQYPDMEEDE